MNGLLCLYRIFAGNCEFGGASWTWKIKQLWLKDTVQYRLSSMRFLCLLLATKLSDLRLYVFIKYS